MSARLRLPARASITSQSALKRGLAAAGIAVAVAGGASACTSGGNPTAPQLYSLRMCESGGNYGISTGNGYYGAYQFSVSTWRGLGYGGYPHQASPATQDAAVRTLFARAGWSSWLVCGQHARYA
ncbi:MAG TPA: transglycosylase family protein [Frankiaceae bacterium]|nr:transglycosylase family protein [Frankiaceae bacterium]